MFAVVLQHHVATDMLIGAVIRNRLTFVFVFIKPMTFFVIVLCT